MYLIGWVVETLFDAEKRKSALRELIPGGQQEIYERLIETSIQDGLSNLQSAAAE